MKMYTLNTRVPQDLDPDLLDFLTTYVDSFIKWELLLFFHQNPNTFDTAEGIARYLGRDKADVQDALLRLKTQGLLDEVVVGTMLVYVLKPNAELQEKVQKFVDATNDREFRRKAIYHLIRK